MAEAYFVLIFDEATDVYKAGVGLDRRHREERHCTTFAAELRLTRMLGLAAGDEVAVSTQLLDLDEKRHHFIHRMTDVRSNSLAATMEVLSLHVDLRARRVTPFPADVHARLQQLMAEHARLPWPPQAGRPISLHADGAGRHAWPPTA